MEAENTNENKTSKDLFFLLLQKDIRNYVERNITIPEDLKSRGYKVVDVDFYSGSLGNLGLDTVVISASTKGYTETGSSSCILFSVKIDGSYNNLRLIEAELNFILNLSDTLRMEDSKYYNIHNLENVDAMETIKEKINQAIAEENYEWADKLKSKLAKFIGIVAMCILFSSCGDPDFYGYITVNSIENNGGNSSEEGVKRSDYRYDVYCKTNIGDGLHLFTNYAYQVGDTLGSRRQFLGNSLNSSRSMSETNDSLRRVIKNKQIVIDSMSVELAQKNALLKYLTPSK